MKQQEIQERNKQIALMLGLNHDEEAIVFNMQSYSWDMLRFHRDWNWLMETVEFIEEKLKLETVISIMGFGSNNQYININRGISIINETYDNPSKIMGKASTKKEAVFIAVSDFAKLYNEGKL